MMHLSVYLTKPERRAKVLVYTQNPDESWSEDVWEADTLEDAASEAGFDLGPMNEAYEQLAALGVETVSLMSYTKDGMDTNDPAEAKRWQAFFRHPENSGHSSTGKGRTAAEALLDCVKIEAKRQRTGLEHQLAYHERAAENLRDQLREDA